MPYKYLLLLLLFPFCSVAQELGGLWRGSMQTGVDTLRYELVISGGGDDYKGYAMTVFRIAGHDNIGIKTLKLKFKKGYLTFMDEELIYDNYTIPPKRVVMSGRLFYQERKAADVLTGEFFSRVPGFRPSNDVPDGGTIFLERLSDTSSSFLLAKLSDLNLKKDIVFARPKQKPGAKAAIAKTKTPVTETKPAEVIQPAESSIAKVVPPPVIEEEKPRRRIATPEVKRRPVEEPKKPVAKQQVETAKQEPVKTQPVPIKQNPVIIDNTAAAEVSARKTEIIDQVDFVSDSLVFSLYDNGSVDGDTVSVLINNRVIIAKKRLTVQAIRETIYITPDMGDSLQVVMYAENLGDIPPNTGLLVVQDGNRRHEIRFSGDLQKSSAIVLRRRRQ